MADEKKKPSPKKDAKPEGAAEKLKFTIGNADFAMVSVIYSISKTR